MRWLARWKLKLFRGQTGFTLIEVLIAVGILAAIGAGFLTAMDTNARAVRDYDEQVTAANLASAYLEAIKESPWDVTYPNAGDNIATPSQYTVDIDIGYSNDSTTWADTYTDETLERITVIISRDGKYVFSLCTYRSER